MINLLLLLVFLACIGVGAAWIAENPGQLTIHFGDYRIDTSLAVITGVVVCASLAIMASYAVLAHLFHLPGAWVQRKSLKHYREGMKELTWSVASLAASDIASAQTHTKKAEKWLGVTPITLLLSTQIARSKGDDAHKHELLEKMLEFKETEYLSARLLSESAGKQKLLPKALALAQHASAVNPHEHVAALSVVSLHTKLGQWSDAMRALDNCARKIKLPRSKLNRLRGVILYAQTQAWLEEGNDSSALGSAKKMLRYLPDFPPAIIMAAECYHENHATDKAIKLLLSGWERTAHPDIATRLRHISLGSAPKKREKILAKIEGVLHDENLMPWRCNTCGEASHSWHAHCPSCSSFDTLQSVL
jgi:HemY protein